MSSDPSSASPFIVRYAAVLTVVASATLLIAWWLWGLGAALVAVIVALFLATSVGQFVYLQVWKKRTLERLQRDKP